MLGGRLGEFAVAQIDNGHGLVAVMALEELLEAARAGA
jgi:hypothetical protein